MTEEHKERNLRHGQWPSPEIESLLQDDPELLLAAGDIEAWSQAHPCECEALCECDE